MSTLTPIEGAGDTPMTVHTFPVYGGAEIGASSKNALLSGINLTTFSRMRNLSGIDLSKQTQKSAVAGIELATVSIDKALGGGDVTAGDTFLILADIIPEVMSVASLAQAAYVEINARLMVNDVEVAIKDFNYQKPTGRLGSLLNVTLADPDIDLVPTGASIDFSIVITADGNEHLYPLMTNAKLTDRDFSIRYKGGKNDGPIDEVTFGSLDVLADKFTLGPRRPVIMYDPLRVRFDEVRTTPDNCIRDFNTGQPILPIIEPVSGLTMKQILMRAYTGLGGAAFANVISTGQLAGIAWAPSYVGGAGNNQVGCGFSNIITNIQDYRVRRADFTVEGGWHDGATPVVAMYEPVYFPSGTNLVILDVDQPLPFGVTAYDLTLSRHKALSQRASFQADKNAVLITYQYMGNDPWESPQKQFREIETTTYPVDSSTSDGGANYGDEGYIKQTLKERVREYFMPDDPDNVLDTIPISTQTIVEQTYVCRNDLGQLIFQEVRTTSIEDTDHYYAGDLKTGHKRTLQSRVFWPSSLDGQIQSKMITIQDETCEISWTDDPRQPGVKLQDRVVTTLKEVCSVDPDGVEIMVDGDPYDHHATIPLIEANLGNFMTDQWKLTPLTITMTKTELLRKRKNNQYDVLVTEIDHLNGGGARSSISNPVVGSASHDQYETKQRTVLLRDLVSEAEIGPRIPIAVNAYELPRDRALTLGKRRLYRAVNPLRNMPIDLPTPDFSLDRGSVVRGQTRDGYTGKFIVTGYAINGQALGKDREHRIFQNLECLELLA